jgi:uncharacterized membrane protein
MKLRPQRKLFSAFTLWMLAIVFGASACSFKVDKKGTAADDGSFGFEVPASLVNSVSYSMVAGKVFQAKCVSCHGSSGGVSLETYDSAHAALDRIKRVVFTETTMPKAPGPALSQDELMILAAWIKAGGPSAPLNGDPDHQAPPPVLEPKFDSIKSIIIDKKCISCHSPGGKAERIPFLTKENFLNSPLDIVIPGNADESDIVLVLLDGARKPMPPQDSGFSRVSSQDLAIIKEWINHGASD